MSVQDMVYVYLFVCVCMIAFNIVYVLMYNSKDGRGRRRDRNIKNLVEKQILSVEKNKTLPSKDMRRMRKKCRNMWNLAVWAEKVEQMQEKHPQATDMYLSLSTEMFRNLADDLEDKSYVEKAHYAYVVEKFNMVQKDFSKRVLNFILDMTKSTNLYCRQNALKVLFSYGDVRSVKRAVNNISKSGVFYHEKLLVDGLLTFQGDKRKLMDALLEGLEEKSPFMQRIILNYIRYGSDGYQELFWNILKDTSQDDENRFIAIRYFAKHPDQEVYPLLKQFVMNPDEQRWEYAAITATALGYYPGEETTRILKSCLSHKNWYIRHNAARSLERFSLPYEEMRDVLEGEDRYAKEIIEYRMQMQATESEGAQVG